MNKQLAELAAKSGFDVGIHNGLILGNFSDMYKLDKFAELIVRECARVARSTPCPYFDEHMKQQLGHTWDMAVWEAGHEIVKHFGVE
jgi:hypothetical protein